MENFDDNYNNSEFYYEEQRPLPNADVSLILGILSIVFCWCYGVPGSVLGIVALILSSKARKEYQKNPDLYTPDSYRNCNTGRICAIIGLSVSAIWILIMIGYFFLVGTMIWSDMMNSYY